MADKPRYRVVAKSKTTNKYQDVFAFWENEKGISGVLDRRVKKITVELEGGQLAMITNESCWFNLQVRDDGMNQDTDPKPEDYQNQEVNYPDDEVPF